MTRFLGTVKLGVVATVATLGTAAIIAAAHAYDLARRLFDDGRSHREVERYTPPMRVDSLTHHPRDRATLTQRDPLDRVFPT